MNPVSIRGKTRVVLIFKTHFLFVRTLYQKGRPLPAAGRVQNSIGGNCSHRRGQIILTALSSVLEVLDFV